MSMSDVVKLAAEIATAAHFGQVDKIGQPYIDHPRRVAERVEQAGGSDYAIAIAWLHDTIEDTGHTATSLIASGVPWPVVYGVLALTRVQGESSEDYYGAIKASGAEAIQVKFADIADNTDPARVAQLDPATRARLAEKYAKAIAALS